MCSDNRREDRQARTEWLSVRRPPWGVQTYAVTHKKRSGGEAQGDGEAQRAPGAAEQGRGLEKRRRSEHPLLLRAKYQQLAGHEGVGAPRGHCPHTTAQVPRQSLRPPSPRVASRCPQPEPARAPGAVVTPGRRALPQSAGPFPGIVQGAVEPDRGPRSVPGLRTPPPLCLPSKQLYPPDIFQDSPLLQSHDERAPPRARAHETQSPRS